MLAFGVVTCGGAGRGRVAAAVEEPSARSQAFKGRPVVDCVEVLDGGAVCCQA